MHSRGGLASESSPSRVISASKPTSFQNSAAVRRAAQRRPACAVIENEAASRSRNKSHNIVKQAEEELSDYCSTLYEDDGSEVERCWLAYNWLDERLANTDAACEIEVRDGVVNGVDCQRLDKFQDFVREIVAQGNVRNMVRTLAVLAAAEKRKQAKADGDASPAATGSTAELAAAASASSPSPAGDALKDHLAELFRQFDADGNGRLDVQEFREAMKHLGNELSAASVNVIFTSLDIHGWVGLDEFVAIVEAEELRAHTRFSKSLRSIGRGSSSWWTDIPHAIDQLL